MGTHLRSSVVTATHIHTESTNTYYSGKTSYTYLCCEYKVHPGLENSLELWGYVNTSPSAETLPRVQGRGLKRHPLILLPITPKVLHHHSVVRTLQYIPGYRNFRGSAKMGIKPSLCARTCKESSCRSCQRHTY